MVIALEVGKEWHRNQYLRHYMHFAEYAEWRKKLLEWCGKK